METTQPHGLLDRQPAVLLTGNKSEGGTACVNNMYECTFPKDRTDREYRRFLRAIMLQFASHIFISGVTDLVLLLFWRWERETRIASGPDSLVLAQESVSIGLISYDLVTAESQPSHQQTSHPGKATMNSSSHWKVSLDMTSSNTHITETVSGNVIRLTDSPTFDSLVLKENTSVLRIWKILCL